MILTLHVTLSLPGTLPPEVRRLATAEAADIWSPYGVVVDVAGPCGWAPDGSTVLEVVTFNGRRVEPSPPSRPMWESAGWRGALGAVTFAPDGVPVPVITVFLRELDQLVARASVLGTAETQWPAALRERVIGRVLGRVLAHEIGHIILRTAQHAGDGLMRPLQFANDLVSPSRRRFTLAPIEVERLSNW